MSGLTRTASSHSGKQLFNLQKVFVIPTNTGESPASSTFAHQCVMAGEAKRLSTGTEKNPWQTQMNHSRVFSSILKYSQVFLSILKYS